MTRQFNRRVTSEELNKETVFQKRMHANLYCVFSLHILVIYGIVTEFAVITFREAFSSSDHVVVSGHKKPSKSLVDISVSYNSPEYIT